MRLNSTRRFRDGKLEANEMHFWRDLEFPPTLKNNAVFDVGGTIVGDVQYIDSFQRSEFWNVLGEDG